MMNMAHCARTEQSPVYILTKDITTGYVMLVEIEDHSTTWQANCNNPNRTRVNLHNPHSTGQRAVTKDNKVKLNLHMVIHNLVKVMPNHNTLLS